MPPQMPQSMPETEFGNGEINLPSLQLLVIRRDHMATDYSKPYGYTPPNHSVESDRNIILRDRLIVETDDADADANLNLNIISIPLLKNLPLSML
jgi:hypothetical protein